MKKFSRQDFVNIPTAKPHRELFSAIEEALKEKRFDQVHDHESLCEHYKDLFIASDCNQLMEDGHVTHVVRDNMFNEVCVLTLADGTEILYVPTNCSYADFKKVFDEFYAA